MKTQLAVLAATLLAGVAGTAMAQNAGTFDPDQLPAIHGKVAEYSLTPRGDVDGLILTDGTEVHLPPHLGTQLVFALRPGDAVTIHGLRARAIPLVQAMSVTNDATGASVTDNSPAAPRGPRAAEQKLTAEGRVKEQLNGPQGELNGALLDDGTIVHLPPPEAQRLASELKPAAMLFVEGEGYTGSLGRVIGAESIGPNPTRLAQIAAPPPPGRGRRLPPPGGPAMAPPAAPDAPPPPPAR